MPALARLLKTGSMAQSLGVYVPAMVLHKAVALGRVLLFTYLLSKVEYGLWGLGMMLFNLAAPLVALGTNHGLTRYVSFYEVRGQLRALYRRMRVGVVACAVAMTIALLLASDRITSLVLTWPSAAPGAARTARLYVCWAALASALLGALYHNVLGFLGGMRAYRLVSALEVLFALLFTIIGAGTLAIAPTGLALLLAHVAAVAVTLAAAAGGLKLALSAREAPGPTGAPEPGGPVGDPPGAETNWIAQGSPAPAAPGEPAGGVKGAYLRVLRYGLAALAETLSWFGAMYVSFYLVSRRYGPGEGGVFYVFLMLCQPIALFAGAAYAVVFSHVARLWSAEQRPAATLRLEVAYKAVVLVTMTLAVIAYATGPIWCGVLPTAYRPGAGLLGGVLMFYQALNHLALLSMVARLRERPIVTALATLAGGAGNAALALAWMPHRGPEGAAWAAGIGMFAGGSAVAAAYLLAARCRLHPTAYFVLLLPAAMLLPVPILVPVWGAVLALALLTPAVFSREQRSALAGAIRGFRSRGGD